MPTTPAAISATKSSHLLREVIESGTLNCTKGTQVKAFERDFAARLGVPHARAVTSGTAAVHTAVAAIDPEPGDEIITTAITDMGAHRADPVPAGDPGVRGRRSGQPQRHRRKRRAAHHAADARDHRDAPVRQSLRHRRHSAARRGARHSGHRGCGAGLPRYPRRTAGRDDRRDRRLQSATGQAHDDGGGRHRRDLGSGARALDDAVQRQGVGLRRSTNPITTSSRSTIA